MREIKFRAWVPEAESFIYTDDFTGVVDNQTILLWGYGDWRKLKVECVQQFTGLKDKNGKEIYEGDIIHSLSPFFTGEGTIHDYDDDYYEVVWMEEEARFCLKKKNGLYAYVDELIEPTVKGNIFENPEILEEQHG
jgi:uncharacterized phage protein (TIGR01671 family)